MIVAGKIEAHQVTVRPNRQSVSWPKIAPPDAGPVHKGPMTGSKILDNQQAVLFANLAVTLADGAGVQTKTLPVSTCQGDRERADDNRLAASWSAQRHKDDLHSTGPPQKALALILDASLPAYVPEGSERTTRRTY